MDRGMDSVADTGWRDRQRTVGRFPVSYGRCACRFLAVLALAVLPSLMHTVPGRAQGPAAAPRFQDVTKAMGLQIGNDAACWVDIDRDGWTDLITAGTVWRNNQGRS